MAEGATQGAVAVDHVVVTDRLWMGDANGGEQRAARPDFLPTQRPAVHGRYANERMPTLLFVAPFRPNGPFHPLERAGKPQSGAIPSAIVGCARPN